MLQQTSSCSPDAAAKHRRLSAGQPQDPQECPFFKIEVAFLKKYFPNNSQEKLSNSDF